MYIKKMDENSYKMLLEFILNKSEKCLLFKYNILSKFKEEDESRILDIIESDSKYSKKMILSTYSDSLLNDIYDLFKDNMKIFDKEYICNIEQKFPLYKYNIRKDIIYSIVKNFVYKYNIEKFIYDYKSSLIKIYDYNQNIQTPNSMWQSLYLFNIDQSFKSMLKGRNLEDWKYPNNLEDLSFIKDNYYIFYSISHEDEYDIYCENEEEYEYLKSIGVEFYTDHFVKEEKNLWNG